MFWYVTTNELAESNAQRQQQLKPRSLKHKKRWIEISQVAGAPKMRPVGTKAENRLVAGRLNYSNALSKIGNGDDQERLSSLSLAYTEEPIASVRVLF